MIEEHYQRLTGAQARSGFAIAYVARSSLWLGSDHVLSIASTGYTEAYKRFYFRDIETFVIRQTDRHKVWNLVLAVLAGLAGLFAIVVGEPIIRYLLGGFAAVFAFSLGANLLAGPSCICHLRTAVQTEELPSLNRLRRARRVLGRLHPLIIRAQGDWASEQIRERFRELAASTSTAAPDQSAQNQTLPPRIAT